MELVEILDVISIKMIELCEGFLKRKRNSIKIVMKILWIKNKTYCLGRTKKGKHSYVDVFPFVFIIDKLWIK